jgi:hypothetical protein
LQLFTRELIPLVGIQSGEAKLILSSSLNFASARASAFELNTRPDDAEVFVPDFSRYTPASRGFKTPRTLRASAHIAGLIVRILNNEAMFLAVRTGKGVAAEYSSLTDRSGSMKVTIATLSAVDEQSTGGFRNLLECPTSPGAFLVALVDRVAAIIKQPVYRKIECALAPFQIRIPLKFIQSLTKLFPTARDLRMLNIDTDEQLDEEGEVLGDTETEDEAKCIFCQEFVFRPFHAVLNLRRKEKGVFSEFNDLAFQYKGIHVYNFHGTQGQLTSYAKRNLKLSLLKALPAMLLRKKRMIGSGETKVEES